MRDDRIRSTASAREPRRKPWVLTLACAALVLAAIPVGATGWVKLLSRTAAEQFQEDDLRMFLEAGRNALNAEGPPKTVAWSNPKNETGGSFLVLSETTRSGLPCKRIKFATYAPGYPNPPKVWTTWTVCKVDDRWKVADTK